MSTNKRIDKFFRSQVWKMTTEVAHINDIIYLCHDYLNKILNTDLISIIINDKIIIDKKGYYEESPFDVKDIISQILIDKEEKTKRYWSYFMKYIKINDNMGFVILYDIEKDQYTLDQEDLDDTVSIVSDDNNDL